MINIFRDDPMNEFGIWLTYRFFRYNYFLLCLKSFIYIYILFTSLPLLLFDIFVLQISPPTQFYDCLYLFYLIEDIIFIVLWSVSGEELRINFIHFRDNFDQFTLEIIRNRLSINKQQWQLNYMCFLFGLILIRF